MLQKNYLIKQHYFEKGKLINKDWKNNKLNILIYECLNIENNIATLNKINDKKIKNNNNLNQTIQFNYDNYDINKLIEQISTTGKIEDNNNNETLFDSKIEFDQNLVKEWLNNKKFKTELLYRKTTKKKAFMINVTIKEIRQLSLKL